MSALIKYFYGSYPDLAKRLGLDSVCLRGNEGRETYRAHARVDIRRTSWYSPNLTMEEIEKQFLEPDSLEKSADPFYSYTQGDFDGRVFSGNQVITSDIYLKGVVEEPGGSHSTSFSNILSVAYTNDAGTACGFTLAYVRDDRDTSIEKNQRKYLFSATLITGANEAPADRQVLFFAHPALTISTRPEALTNLTETVETAQVAVMIKERLNSRELSECIDSLFVGDSISVDHFSQVKRRFPSGRNMDNRDDKRVMLGKLGQLAGTSSQDMPNDPQQNTHTHSGFFSGEQFTGNLRRIYDSTQEQSDPDERKKAQLVYQIIRLRLFLETPWIAANQSPREILTDHIKGLEDILERPQLGIEEKTQAINHSLIDMRQAFSGLQQEEKKTIVDNHERKVGMLPASPAAVLKPVKPQKLDIPFSDRNFYPLLLALVAGAAILGLALTFSGVFTPLGLILTGTSATLALTATAFSMAVLIMAGLKIIYNELRYVQAENESKAYDRCPFHQLDVEKQIALDAVDESEAQFEDILRDFPASPSEVLSIVEPIPHFSRLFTHSSTQAGSSVAFVDSDDDSPASSPLSAPGYK